MPDSDRLGGLDHRPNLIRAHRLPWCSAWLAEARRGGRIGTEPTPAHTLRERSPEGGVAPAYRIVSYTGPPHSGVPTFNVVDTQAGDRNLADRVLPDRPGPAAVVAA
jgi:hypothetical protein